MERVVEIAKELVTIESETKNEKKLCEYIYNLLKEIGMKPEKQFFEDDSGRFNLICFGSGPLIVNGHMDTVPIGKNWTKNPLGELVGDKLYGRGSSDTKGNIACMIAALEKNPTDKITIVFNCQEENGFEGIMEVLKLRETKLKHIKYSISLEPTDGRILHCNKGQYTFEITATGKAVHSSMP
ncbi:M20/M25/M40 family metallo-hydrolase, partial [Candidatus Micrarchaeota archaeon]|nr:M20/M25/M40 family metallo-hydrolase [Candidatus Micrarchaeota archaeon]